MSWFYLALLVPLLYAIVNLLDDNLLHHVYEKNSHLATSIAGFFGMLPLLSLIWVDASTIPPKIAFLSTVSGVLFTCFLYFYFQSLAKESPGVVVALLGIVPAFLPVLAYFILGERLSAAAFVGFLIVLIPSVALAMPNWKEFKFTKAIIPLLAAVFFQVVISISTKYVYDRADFYIAFMFFSLGLGIGGLLFYALDIERNKQSFKQLQPRLKKLLPVFLLAELTALCALFVLSLATARGPITLVKVIEGIQPMFVIVVALALHPFWPKYFREAEEGGIARKLSLMAVIVIGLGIIAAGEQ